MDTGLLYEVTLYMLWRLSWSQGREIDSRLAPRVFELGHFKSTASSRRLEYTFA